MVDRHQIAVFKASAAASGDVRCADSGSEVAAPGWGRTYAYDVRTSHIPTTESRRPISEASGSASWYQESWAMAVDFRR